MPPEELRGAVAQYGTPGLVAELDAAVADPGRWHAWDLNRLFYRAVLNEPTLTAVDLHGTPRALAVDLNHPLPSSYPPPFFDLVVNTGTAEHVFDVAQVLRTCHDCCKPGGLMMHTFPVLGWVDHGFWTTNPCLLNDLAAANGYEVVSCYLWEAPRLTRLGGAPDAAALADAKARGADVTAHVVWRRPEPAAAFVVPRQGRYQPRSNTET